MDERAELGLPLDPSDPVDAILIDEIDQALRPPVHERRTASVGTIVAPLDPLDEARLGLGVLRRPIGAMPLVAARRFADGRSSWILRRDGGPDEWVVFDRPAGSERDLVVLAEVSRGRVVQRHATGAVRIVGAFGVLRHEGIDWHHEPPVSSWVDSISVCPEHGDRHVLDTLLQFAVHDLGSRGIGATLVYRPDPGPGDGYEVRLPPPPPLDVMLPAALAPLRHALAQVDGAAVFDGPGVLRELGVRLVPTPEAEAVVDGFRGMRHTSGRRYSFDDPTATVIVVSEDGPVTVLRGGALLAISPASDDIGPNPA